MASGRKPKWVSVELQTVVTTAGYQPFAGVSQNGGSQTAGIEKKTEKKQSIVGAPEKTIKQNTGRFLMLDGALNQLLVEGSLTDVRFGPKLRLVFDLGSCDA